MKGVAVAVNDISGLFHFSLKSGVIGSQINPVGRLDQEKASAFIGVEMAYGLLRQYHSQRVADLANFEFQHLHLRYNNCINAQMVSQDPPELRFLQPVSGTLQSVRVNLFINLAIAGVGWEGFGNLVSRIWQEHHIGARMVNDAGSDGRRNTRCT
jgi:hypothetical protein